MDPFDQRLTDAGAAWRQSQPEPPDLNRIVARLEPRRVAWLLAATRVRLRGGTRPAQRSGSGWGRGRLQRVPQRSAGHGDLQPRADLDPRADDQPASEDAGPAGGDFAAQRWQAGGDPARQLREGARRGPVADRLRHARTREPDTRYRLRGLLPRSGLRTSPASPVATPWAPPRSRCRTGRRTRHSPRVPT